MPISKKQRLHLKGLAHHLNPVVIVGQHGLTEGVLNETSLTLETHELIKMRINAGDRIELAYVFIGLFKNPEPGTAVDWSCRGVLFAPSRKTEDQIAGLIKKPGSRLDIDSKVCSHS